MSRVLVTYVDALDNVTVAAEADSERDAGSATWRELIALVGSDAALADYRRELRLLPVGASVRFVIVRTDRVTPTPVCSYGLLITAQSALRSLAALVDYTYGVRVAVETTNAVHR